MKSVLLKVYGFPNGRLMVGRLVKTWCGLYDVSQRDALRRLARIAEEVVGRELGLLYV